MITLILESPLNTFGKFLYILDEDQKRIKSPFMIDKERPISNEVRGAC